MWDPVEVRTPRDRDGSFEPKLVAHAPDQVGRPGRSVIARFAYNLLRWTSVVGLFHPTVRAARTLRRRLLALSGPLTRTARRAGRRTTSRRAAGPFRTAFVER
jgi:hypothetical protein